MNATELFNADGKSAGIWYCSKCRMVAPSQQLAEQCCQNHKCSVCGKDAGRRHWTICTACEQAKEDAKEAERFAKATKLTEKEWDGYVFCNDEYYPDTGEFRALCDGGDDVEYVWACKEEHFVVADIDSLLESIYDKAYEDFDSDTLNGIPELQKAIDAFNDANKGVISYWPDYTKAVILEKGAQ